MATKPDATSSYVLKNENGKDVLRMGVIGYGYWGPNVVRNFHAQEQSRVMVVCDKSPKSLQRLRQAHADIQTTNDCDELLTSTSIDAVAVVTPVWTHFELAKKALENGKHVFVEKPFTSTTAQALTTIGFLNGVDGLFAESGSTTAQSIQSENQQQAADQVSMSNSIGSLRTLSVIDWRDF